jgi:hypothetical protein
VPPHAARVSIVNATDVDLGHLTVVFVRFLHYNFSLPPLPLLCCPHCKKVIIHASIPKEWEVILFLLEGRAST